MKKALLLASVSVVASMLVAVGCSSDDTDTSGGDGGTGTTGDSGGGGGGDGGSGTTGDGGTGTDGSTAGTGKAGRVTIVQSDIAGQTYSTLTASFLAAADVASGGCTTPQTFGSCQVTTCSFAAADAGATQDAGAATYPNAGTVTFTGNSGGDGGVLALTPRSDGTYMPIAQPGLYKAGDTASVSASGGDVPAFSAKTVTIPADITVAGDLSTIDPSKDLTVTWTGATSGDVVVNLIAEGTDSTGTIACTFSASAGTGTVPAGALAAFPKCPSGGTAHCAYQVFPSANTPFTAGDWSLGVTAYGAGDQGVFANP